MKNFLKYLLLSITTIIVTIFIITFMYKDAIFLFLNIYEEYKNQNTNIQIFNTLTDYTPLETMDYKDVIYKDTNGTKLTLDIYGSKNGTRNPSPVIIYVHGGSWIYGDKSIPDTLDPILNEFRNNGFTIISLQYQLLDETISLDKPICDVKDAIRWIYKNKDTYNFDINDIGLMGLSSGAHLSLLAGYSSNNDFTDDYTLAKYPSKVKYIIDIFGPTDLSTLDVESIEPDIKSKLHIIEKLNILNDKYNPINYINDATPKTFILHSKDDTIVPYSNSIKLYEKLIEFGVNSKLLTLESSGHDFEMLNENDAIAVIFELLKFLVINTAL